MTSALYEQSELMGGKGMKMNREYFVMEEIVKLNQHRVYFHAYQLKVQLHDNFNMMGSHIIFWNLYRHNYLSHRPLATYFNYLIRQYVKNKADHKVNTV